MKIQNYSLTEIFEKKLLFFIPFYIFTYENKFEEYNNSNTQMHTFLKEYEYIRNKLEELAISGEISEYTKRTLMEMCGKVLDYEAKDILNKGISRGITKGKLDLCLELLRDGLLSYSEAAKRLQISETELRKMMK